MQSKEKEDQQDIKNRAIVAAMTDDELRRIKSMIQDEQLKRLNTQMKSLSADIDKIKKGEP